MTGRLASGKAGLRVWTGRLLILALPLPLLALAAAAFALAPNRISQRASARPDQGLLPPTPRASAPAKASAARFAVTTAAVIGGERALSRPRRAVERRRVEP
jgi:hypothetical protein